MCVDNNWRDILGFKTIFLFPLIKMWGSLELLQFLGGCKKVHKHCHRDVTIGRPCQTIHNLTKLQPFLTAIPFFLSNHHYFEQHHHHRDSHNDLDQWQLRSWLPNYHQFAKLARAPPPTDQITGYHPYHQYCHHHHYLHHWQWGIFATKFLFTKMPGYKDDDGCFQKRPNLYLTKKIGSKGQSFEFSIWVAPLLQSFGQILWTPHCNPDILTAFSGALKCAPEVFICNKYFGDKFFTRNKYFCDKPQIPWEHWHWHFLPGNLTKLLFVTYDANKLPLPFLPHQNSNKKYWGKGMNNKIISFTKFWNIFINFLFNKKTIPHLKVKFQGLRI